MVITTPEIALNGYLVTPFVAMSTLLFGIYGIISNYMALKKNTKIIGLIWTLAAVLNILNIVFIPYFGILGAAIVTLVSYCIAFLISVYYALQHFKIDFDLKFILKSLITSILISLIIIFSKPQSLLEILIVICFAAISYIVLMILMKGINENEIQFFKNMIIK